MAEWREVCVLGELIEGRGRAVDVDGLRVAIYRVGEEVYALSGRCPHANGPLGHGWLEDGEVVCPLHRWRFRLSDGRCTTMHGQDVHRFACEIREGVIWVNA